MKDKKYLFVEMPIPKAVATLSIPMVISSLVMVIYNLADTYFVGMLNNSIETAAVTLAAPVLLSFSAITNLFGVGCSSLMSRALGMQEYKMVKQTSVFGIYCCILFASILSLSSTVFRTPLLHLLGAQADTISSTEEYMFWTVSCGAVPAILNVVMANMVRSEGSAFHASIGTMSGCLLNIVLDPLFILPWGLNMKAAGAGCATFISNCVACLYFFFLIYKKRKSTFVCVKPSLFTLNGQIIREVCKVGIPAMIQNLLNVTGMTILNNFTAEFGAEAVSAMGITHKINMIPMYIAMGTGQGIMPLVGYNYASKNAKRMKSAILFTAKLEVGFILIVTAFYFFQSDFIISIFMKDPTIVMYGARLLKGFCLGLVFLSIDFLGVGIFQAVGMGKESFIFALMRKVVLEIPAIIVLNKIWPLYGLAYSQLIAEFFLAIAAIYVLRKLFRKVDAA